MNEMCSRREEGGGGKCRIRVCRGLKSEDGGEPEEWKGL